MLELVRLDSISPVTPEKWIHSLPTRRMVLGLARTAEELKEVQRLRCRVFTEEMGVLFSEGIDQDYFDAWCEHIMVCEVGTGQVVGTYRVLTPEKARAAGSYYSETEFDLAALDILRDSLVEVGRSCIHPDYRQGGVIMFLWSGVAEIMRRGGYNYLLGCASVSLRDGGRAAAKVWRTAYPQLQEATFRVVPRQSYPLEKLNEIKLPSAIPPLIKGYLKLGAKVCGEPAWDPDFNTVDFPILLNMNDLDKRYQRHFGLS